MMRLPVALLFAVLALGAAAPAADLSFSEAGLLVDAGAMGTFTIEWPQLDNGGQVAPAEVRVEGQTARLRYPGGEELTAQITDGVRVTYRLAQRPAAGRLRIGGLLDFNLSEGGTWQMDDQPAQPFPPAQPPAPHLWQAVVDTFTITDPQGNELALQLPMGAWVQLQDNREWGWKMFAWFFVAPIQDNLEMAMTIGSRTATGPARVVVDALGQDANSDWEGKMHDVAELQTDLADEAAWAATLPQEPNRDVFGGREGSRDALGLEATGYFHVQKTGGRWYLVDPAGNAFFHRGICVFGTGDDYTYIEGREPIYAWLPPYQGEYNSAFRPNEPSAFSFHRANLIRRDGGPVDAAAMARRNIDRARAWGFTSVGAFSGVPGEVLAEKQFPYVSSLPLGQWDYGLQRLPGLNETWDPFDTDNQAIVERAFSERLPGRAEDPLLIGYYLINEPAYQDIPRVVPGLDGQYAAKHALVDLLRGRYATIADFNAAWDLDATDFDALVDLGLPVTTAAASADMAAYYEHFLETYFQLVHDTFRKYDPNHMLLGNRYQSMTTNNEMVCRVTGKYVDVYSFNYYTHFLDTEFLRKLSTWAGDKPMFLSEFHWASPPDSGLPGGARDVNSQVERGLAYRNYLEQAAATGFVVGLEWFTLIDQARTGRWFQRYSGENGNTGLLSVVDRPWRAAIEPMALANARAYDVWTGAEAPWSYDNERFSGLGNAVRTAQVMRAPGPINLDGTTAGWPGMPAEEIASSRLAQGADAEGLSATFRLAWTDEHLHLLCQVVDSTPRQNTHTGADIWMADGAELFIGLEEPDQTGPLLFTDRQVLLSAGVVDGTSPHYLANAPAQAPLELVSLPTADGYVLQAAIPWSSLGLTPTPGLRLRFDLAIDDSTDGNSRRAQLVWSGTDRNSGDRSAWGRAVLGE